ncbi:MAG: AMP-binding protein, partial [Catenulispora sp.]|nr:AMP-binding protein [Catenulispora sp.]
MGDYGDPSNFEWKQYFITDSDGGAMYEACPLNHGFPEDAAEDSTGAGDPAVAAAHGFVHKQFEQQAAKTPTAVAVIAGDDVLDYRTLDRRANRLAHTLAAEGVRPEHRVGVVAERSADTVV